jgi:2,5-diamino-6-(ribosylamino)-4(3H)-pyrimidinone 5'-phosphate reductase
MWHKEMTMKRPYTFMLVAVTLDGKISPKRKHGQPNPIGPSLIDADIMALHNSKREEVDGIMAGLNCILLDDSRLTLRDGMGRNPIRIVLDGLAEIPSTARVLNGEAPTIIAVTQDAPAKRVAKFKERGAEIVVSGHGRYVNLPPLMNTLSEKFRIRRLVVEGGGTVHRSMIAANLYDEIHLIICPFVMGGSTSITPVERMAFWPRGHVPRYRLKKADILGDYLYVVYRIGDLPGKIRRDDT